MHCFGPVDSDKSLTWTKPDGSTQSYPISLVGGGFPELEVRLREDGQALWLVSPDRRGAIATLDLQTGEFTADGGVYDSHGEQSMDRSGTPRWAGMTAGRVLAHKRFW